MNPLRIAKQSVMATGVLIAAVCGTPQPGLPAHHHVGQQFTLDASLWPDKTLVPSVPPDSILRGPFMGPTIFDHLGRLPVEIPKPLLPSTPTLRDLPHLKLPTPMPGGLPMHRLPTRGTE